jgi:hypothetical protein
LPLTPSASRIAAEYRILVDVESNEAYAGAAIAGHPDNNSLMFATVFTAGSHPVDVRPIYLTEEQKNFLSKLKVAV